ncbi:transcription factor ORG2-like [Tripterygium wilfordii]|uniref:transcription factor ORG2-like n=1 Tax=Tripterygium wilfordii TaxID=458696 RepID=UPI0018F81C49|nr:transcription factor ORG2-like [Tripterygium wilfordii]
MLALSPSVFSTFGWLLEESLISHETTTDDHQSLLDDQYYLSQPPAQQPTSEPLHAFTSCGTVDHQVPNNNSKKLNHNASERHRRKKINGFYSSLRSLLPFDDQKKLSIPATVARVTKYIPELQQEVVRLVQKKEDLCARLSGHTDRVVDHDQEKKLRRKLNHTSSCAV